MSEREAEAEQGFSIGGAGIDPAAEELALDRASQCARAATLDLTPSEKAELARSHAVATNP
ncbi:MAG TPA: hypothetical protein VHZ32_02735 [Rhizomicrobium sp.]|nr:hypothetical protein [Rhizomicrobium sp.]